MEELKIYSVSDEYTEYLRKEEPNVYSNKIYKNVELIYKQKAENDTSAGYVKSALNYKELEKLCDKYLIKDE